MPYLKPNTQKRQTCHLFIGNAGPLWGITAADVRCALRPFCSDDSSLLISTRDDTSHFWHVTFPGRDGVQEATAALKALAKQPCEVLGGRPLVVKYAKWMPEDAEADAKPQLLEHEQQLCDLPVACTTEEANIPGLQIYHDFVTKQEEQAMLHHIDQLPWQYLSKRRVQHYGYKFEYTKRGVDLKQQVGAMPEWTNHVVQKVQALPDVPAVDQLTVNEYTPGVGIAPHVDAHSSFTGAILSLSLSGSCIMVFRKAYLATGSSSSSSQGDGGGDGDCQKEPEQQQVCVFLPPRSLLVMSGEARYAWQHYIPHRKIDWVKGQQVPRAQRRVSLTFRKVRGFPCDCRYPEYCDSQLGVLPPTRSAMMQQQEQQQCSTLADTHEQQQQADQQSPPQQQDHSNSKAVHSGLHQLKSISSVELCSSRAAGANGTLPGAGKALAAATSVAAEAAPTNVTTESTAAVDAAAEAAAVAAAHQLESLHVHQVYDVIASHFSSTRFAVWPKVRAFLESLSAGSVVADVGCGNGKYLSVRTDLAVLGSDRSAGLVAVAAERLAAGSTASLLGQGLSSARAAAVFVCDALSLCYRPGSCDGVLCIAVLHHISSRQRRVLLLQQLAAVLRPGGRGLVTVWATQQEDPAKTIQRWHRIQPLDQQVQPQQTRSGAAAMAASSAQAGNEREQQRQQDGGVIEGPDFFVPWHLPFHKAGALAARRQLVETPQAQCAVVVGEGGEGAGCSGQDVRAAAPSGMTVDAAKGAVVFQRYYHLFEQGELEALVASVPSLQVEQVFYDRSNWCVEFVKTA